ncbi:MAG: CTP synthase [Oscillospiraceae bacterium]|nr:CTP synthase [Oscillospiraceae bacterium]
MNTKYIFVTGGVVSGLGKGITAASLGRLLKCRGFNVTIQKLDPYINLDPGTLSPRQHGEVFVTEDGAETDLDLGHYERFIDENLTVENSVTTGKIYWKVLNKERNGAYGGNTVQVIPHITDEIKSRIYGVASLPKGAADIVITEIGGTVGDIESTPFLEAIRQVVLDKGRDNVLYIHVTLMPTIPGSDELKTKPTQHSVKTLLGMGIQPNIIVLRSDSDIPPELKGKIASFCNVEAVDVIENLNADSLYGVPLMLEEEGLTRAVCRHLKIEERKPDLTEWRQMVEHQESVKNALTVGIIGKFVSLPDAYLSVMEALRHAGFANDALVNIRLLNSDDIAKDEVGEILSGCDAIILPDGLGSTEIEGGINAVKYARENKIPFFGICLGMHIAVVEFAANVLGIESSDTTQLYYDMYNVIDFAPNVGRKNDNARIGTYHSKIEDNTIAKNAYGKDRIDERYRHYYEFNNLYRTQFIENGMALSGLSLDGKSIEIMELSQELHPWFLSVLFRPEFKSRPNRPHPLFVDFIKAAVGRKAKDS